MNRFVLIDGNAILHRAYHALPPLTNRNGELLNAVYGFCTMLFKVIADLKPKYLVVAFDTGKPTFRQAEYVGYQAKRPVTDEGLVSQFGRTHELVKAMGIPIFEKEGFEADDVIGTLAQKAAKEKEAVDEVIIVTGDRDLMQLVNTKIKIFAPVKGLSESMLFDEKGVEEKLGVAPKLVVDLKGLIGDASDNYPGVPGIGPKTAIELLKRFKTLEAIYQKPKEVSQYFPQSVVDKLKEGEELARLSQKLAQIVTDVPLRFDLPKCEFVFSDEEKAKTIKILEELRFKSLVARLKEPAEETKKAKKTKEEGQLRLV